MAEEKVLADMYGSSAAYDLYRYNFRDSDGSSAPEIVHPGLPEEHAAPERYRRVKQKTAVAPFSVMGMLVAACMMILVIFGHVQLYEASDRVGKLESQLSSLQEQRSVLESLYEGSIDLAAVETRAAELGFAVPVRDQMVYIHLGREDRAEIYLPERTNFAERILDAIESSVGGLVEYLS